MLLAKPKIMLDEPTASMDAQLRSGFWTTYSSMDENAVVIMATHKSGVMKYKSIIMVGGELLLMAQRKSN